MQQPRPSRLAGAIKVARPAGEKVVDRRKGGEPTLARLAIPRVERRTANQRREDRFRCKVRRADLTFRRRTFSVPVVNVSEGGVMIESDIMPRIGEVLGLKFEEFDRVRAVVRWVKNGRIGLDVGQGTIELD